MQRAKFRSSEAHIRAIIDRTPDAFVAVDLQGTVAAFNRAAETLFGLPASAMLGHPIAQSGLPEALRRCFAGSLRRASAGEPIAEKCLEIEGLRAGQEAFVAEASLFTAGTGKEAVLAARLYDITQRRQAKEKTNRLSRILRTMAEGNQALVRATSEDELFQAMCCVIVESGGYRMAWIGQVEHDEEKSVRPLANAGHEAGYLALAKISWGDNPYGRGPSGMSIRTGTPQFNNDITDNPVMGPWRELALERGYLSSISLPLKDKAGVFGALTIYASEPHAFGPDEVALLVELAGDVSYGVTALRTRREHGEMEQTLRLIAERKQAEDALRESEARLRAFMSATSDVVYRMSPDWTEMRQLDGRGFIADTEHPSEAWLTEYIHPNDQAHVWQAIQKAIETKSVFDLEHRIKRTDGTLGWKHSRAIPLLDAKGEIVEWFGAASDITERKRHEEHIDLLMHEVNHRAKNMLAVVLAVARQTLTSSPQEFIGRFGERIQAMSASQDLLVKNEWRGVDIEELVRSQLAHFNDLTGTRIALHGPPLFISASAAQTIGMALHELATNAGKYGALSNSDGRLEVGWSLECDEGEEDTFVMSWREQGGPPVTAPARRGFGSTVISRMAMESLDAKVDLDFAPEGLSWRLQCAAKEVIDSSSKV